MRIRVNILAGAAAGRALQLEGPGVTLGRDATCDVVIDLPFISRTQCELRADGGQWVLVNHSTNGTRLSRKLVIDKPRPIRAGDVVRVGDEAIAELTPIDDDAPAQPTAPTEATPDTKKKSGGGSRKLWIGIGVYMLIMLALIIFFATLSDKPEEADELADLRTLTAAQIAGEIGAPVTKRGPLEHSERMGEHLQDAREYFALRDSMPDALYRSHEAYRAALSYAPGDTLPDPIDQRRYQLVQDELIEKVETAYRSAESLLFARNYGEAERKLADLSDAYPAGRDSIITRSIDELRATAKRGKD